MFVVYAAKAANSCSRVADNGLYRVGYRASYLNVLGTEVE